MVIFAIISGIIAAAVIVFWITALIQIAKEKMLDPTARALWILIVLFFPILGAILWFIIGSKSQQTFK